MKYFTLMYILFILLTITSKVSACGDEPYIVPLPPQPEMIVMDYSWKKRADIFAERVKSMRLWVAANEH